MYNSKSVLSEHDLRRLKFEAENIAAWCDANQTVHVPDAGCAKVRNCGTHGSFKASDILPVRKLGAGMGGAAYALTNFPGLVIKVCQSERDLYPDWIRMSAQSKIRAFLPRVFCYGGDELTGTFWCVLPEYKFVTDDLYCDTVSHKTHEILNVVSEKSTYQKCTSMHIGSEWRHGKTNETFRKWADRTSYTETRNLWSATPDVRALFVLIPSRDVELKGRSLISHLSKAERRAARKLAKSPFAHAIYEASNYWDMHNNNVMLDGDSIVIIDPVYSCTGSKKSLRSYVHDTHQ